MILCNYQINKILKTTLKTGIPIDLALAPQKRIRVLEPFSVSRVGCNNWGWEYGTERYILVGRQSSRILLIRVNNRNLQDMDPKKQPISIDSIESLLVLPQGFTHWNSPHHLVNQAQDIQLTIISILMMLYCIQIDDLLQWFHVKQK